MQVQRKHFLVSDHLHVSVKRLQRQVADLPASFFPTRFRIDQWQIKLAGQHWEKLAQLIQLIFRLKHTPTESLNFFPKDFMIAVRDPAVDADNRPGGQKLLVDLDAVRWYYTWGAHADGWMQLQSFMHASL